MKQTVKEPVASVDVEKLLDSVTQDIKSLSVGDPVVASLESAASLPVSETASAPGVVTTTDAPDSPTRENADPFANGPIINPRRMWARMTCAHVKCNRKSVENFHFRSYHCHNHGSAIPDQWRLDCETPKCGRATYTFLHPNDNNQAFQCEIHCHNGKSRIFETRFQVRSKDFMLQAGNRENLFISGEDFDEMAFDYSYSSEIKENISRVIQSYQYFLDFDSAVKEKQAGMLQYLDANLDCDADELRKIHNHYRDRLAKGHVYLVLYENKDISVNEKLSIKIGYAKDVDKRLKYYKCKDVPKEFLAVIPSKTTDTRRGPRTDRLEPLLGAHLLEQILHAVLAQRQRDRQCFCKKKGYSIHGEVFDFEPVLGIENEWKAAQSRVEDLKEQMNKWAAIVRKAEEAFKAAYTVHNPILYAIEQKLERAGQSLYNF